MKHNQTCSEMWNAENLLPRQGRRCLDKQSSKERTNLGAGKKVYDGNGADESPRVKVEHHEESSLDVLPAKTGISFAIGNLVSCPAENRASGTTHVKFEMNEELPNTILDKVGSPNSQPLLTEGSREEVIVDILKLPPGEDTRLNFDKHATYFSSSFGDTEDDLAGDEMDCQNCEAESEFRDGNGVPSLTEDLPFLKRKKWALNSDWKAYRQGIEWRCRWLELRVKELQVLSNKYDGILAMARRDRKHQQEEHDSTSARTGAIFGGFLSRVVWRQQRRKEEENIDFKSHMSRHPVFSRYEKKQHHSQEDIAFEETIKDESYQRLDFDDFNPDYDYGFGNDFLLEEDSIEQYLWHIQDLQSHICTLKNQLSTDTLAQSNATGLVRDMASPQYFYDMHLLMHGPGRPKGSSLLGGKVQGGKSVTRRQTLDFSIKDVIVSDMVFIDTTNWQVLGNVSISARGGSSDEDTDDEVYENRHIEMLVKEHQEYASLNKSQNVATTSEYPESAIAEKDVIVITVDGDLVENVQNFPSSLGYVPRRKQRRRESRDIASITRNIGPLLSASHVPEQCKQDNTKEDGNCPKTSSID